MLKAGQLCAITDVAQIVEINLAVLKIRVGVVNATLSFDVESTIIDWKQSIRLSYFQTHARLTTPPVAGAYFELNLNYSDDSGVLTATAQLHTILGPVDPVSTSIQLLPRFVLGLITLGTDFLGTLRYADQIGALGFNYNTHVRFNRLLAESCAEGGVDVASFQNALRAKPELIDTISKAMPTDRATLEAMRGIPYSAWQEALTKVVSDPRLRQMYPSLKDAVILMSDIQVAETTANDVDAAATPIEVVRDILCDIATFASLGGGIILGIAGLLAAFVAILCTPPLTALAIGVLCVALILTIGGLLLLGAALLVFIVHLIIKYVVMFQSSADQIEAIKDQYRERLGNVNFQVLTGVQFG